MIRHIIVWRFKEELEDREGVLKRMKEGLESLKGVVPAIKDITVSIEPMPSSNVEAFLEVIVDDPEGVSAYANHPAHIKVAEDLIKPYISERYCYDYEI